MHQKAMLGLRHLSKRKSSKNTKKQRSSLSKSLDKLVYVAVITGPIMTIPQLQVIWVQHNASGISVSSWATYTILSFFWLFYGLVHEDHPIILSSFIWVILHGLVVVGAVIYS